MPFLFSCVVGVLYRSTYMQRLLRTVPRNQNPNTICASHNPTQLHYTDPNRLKNRKHSDVVAKKTFLNTLATALQRSIDTQSSHLATLRDNILRNGATIALVGLIRAPEFQCHEEKATLTQRGSAVSMHSRTTHTHPDVFLFSVCGPQIGERFDLEVNPKIGAGMGVGLASRD